jgi:hypothetical protein
MRRCLGDIIGYNNVSESELLEHSCLDWRRSVISPYRFCVAVRAFPSMAEMVANQP